MASILNGSLVAESLADKVLTLITEAIEKGEIPPGSRIREATLARQLGISRGPLREALARLEGRRILEYTPNFGMRVATVSLKDVIEIFQMREALEGTACRLATQNMTDEEIDQLAKLLDEHGGHTELREGSSYFQRAGHLDLHYRIAAGSRNQRLFDILCEDLYHSMRVHRYRSSASPGRAALAYAEHRAIIDAMRARDADKAEALMRSHIRNSLDNLTENAEAETSEDTTATPRRRRSAAARAGDKA